MEFTVSTEAFDLISIGGGSGGLACAQRAAEYGAKSGRDRVRPAGRHLRERRLRAEEGHVERRGRRAWRSPTRAITASTSRVASTIGRALKHKRDAYVARLNGIYARNLAAKGVAYVQGRGALRRCAYASR